MWISFKNIKVQLQDTKHKQNSWQTMPLMVAHNKQGIDAVIKIPLTRKIPGLQGFTTELYKTFKKDHFSLNV